MSELQRRTVSIPGEGTSIEGELWLPPSALGLVIFAHGSGSSRHSPRNRYVAGELARSGFGALLIDLLSAQEEAAERWTRHLRFDIGLLAGRLERAALWATREPSLSGLRIGYFGASTGAAAALLAAAGSDRIAAVVSRGGRPDLAGDALERVRAPTLLIVGSEDTQVLELNQEALSRMRCERDLRLVRNAAHLFEEPGALERVTGLADDWFRTHLAQDAAHPSP